MILLYGQTPQRSTADRQMPHRGRAGSAESSPVIPGASSAGGAGSRFVFTRGVFVHRPKFPFVYPISIFPTKQGDMLDDIVVRFYGDSDRWIVESVLEANRGIAAYGPTLPAGLMLKLPARRSTALTKTKFIWI